MKQTRILFSDPKANLWEAAYVPGGRWISFVREPLGEAQRLDLMIAPAEGSPPTAWTRLLADHPWADKPRWSDDGRLLYFLSRGSGDYFNLWALPFDPIRGVPAGTAFRHHQLRFARAFRVATRREDRHGRREGARGIDDVLDDRQHLDARRRRIGRAADRVALIV